MIEAEVISLGHSGDGVIMHEGGRKYVAYAAPGDRLQLALGDQETDRARIIQVLQPGRDRATPDCIHFGDCGGCALQHLTGRFVAQWKRQQIVNVLAQRGLRDVLVRPVLTMPPGTRRRAAFTARRTARGVEIGFNRSRSRQIVAIKACAVLDPAITRALPELSVMLMPVLQPGKTARLLVTQTREGLDADISPETGRPEEPDLGLRNHLAQAAERLDLARLSWRGEVVLTRRQPRVYPGEIAVSLPPAAFLQASAEGEAALTACVTEAIGEKLMMARGARLLDLFAGCGAFTFPVARYAKVMAVEGDKAMAAAIRDAGDHAQRIKPVEVQQRDLMKRPFRPEELSAFDAVVFDPPRAGASRQAEMLASSEICRVVSVSCNPATFARDARILTDGGLHLQWVQPVDQFRWSAEIELVALFARR